MERSGNSVQGAGHHPDLAEMSLRDGPFLTVWARDATFDARVREVARTQDRIPVVVVDDLATAVHDRLTQGAGGVVAIADPTGVLLVESLPHAPRREVERIESLPAFAPLLEHRQGAIASMFVSIDRRGADLVWSDGRESGSSTVEAPDDMMIQKFKDSDSGSGYRQHDFQQKVEDNWDRLAADIAGALSDRAATVRPRVISVAGDVRMVQLLRRHLPSELADRLRDVPGSRSADGSDAHRDEVVARWTRTAVAEDTVEALQVFERERGQADRAADGPDATLAALCEARVDVLLLHDDPDDERRAWFVPDQPTLVATDLSTITALGYEPRDGRLVDVAIRSALASSSGVRVVPAAGPVSAGLGAVLRW